MTEHRYSWCMIAILLVIVGCSNGNGTGSAASVTVINQNGQGMSGVTVVLGDRNGAMKSSAISDENGAVSFNNPPADATITAAYSCLRSGATETTYSFDVRYDVNEPVSLHVNDCSATLVYPGPPWQGTLTLHVTNAIAEVTENEVRTFFPTYPGASGLISTQTLTISAYDLQQDGKLSIYVFGKDATGVPIAYGMAQDLTFTDGMTVDIVVDKLMSFGQYHVTNLPTGVDFLCTDLYQSRTGKGGVFVNNCGSFSSLSTSVTLSVPYIPGLGDQFSYSIAAFVYPSPSVSSGQYLSLHSSGPVSDQEIDFSQALSAPTVTITGQGTATPGLTWSELDPTVDTISASIGFDFAGGFYGGMSIPELSTTRTSINFPELPDSLAEFRPVNLNSFDVTSTAFSGGMYRASSSTYFGLQTFKSSKGRGASIFSRQKYYGEQMYQRSLRRL